VKWAWRESGFWEKAKTTEQDITIAIKTDLSTLIW